MADEKDQAQLRLDKVPINPGDRFIHYKTSGTYEVVTLAIKEDTLEPLVVYRSLEHGTIWARTYKNWSESVEVGSEKVPRFKSLDNPSQKE